MIVTDWMSLYGRKLRLRFPARATRAEVNKINRLLRFLKFKVILAEGAGS